MNERSQFLDASDLTIICNRESAPVNKESATAEFKKNHKKYLELKLLHDLIFDSTIDQQQQQQQHNQHSTSFRSSVASSAEKASRVEQCFWKSFLADDATLDKQPSTDGIRGLDHEQKQIVVERVESHLDIYLAELFGYFRALENGEANEDTCESGDEPQDLVGKVVSLIESVDEKKAETSRHTQSLHVRKANFFNMFTEISHSLKDLLVTLKLDFYAKANAIECQHTLSRNEMLHAKIRVEEKQMVADMYTESRCHALSAIREQLDVDVTRLNDTNERLRTSLD